MNNAINHELGMNLPDATDNSHKFFDPKQPPRPDQVLGIPTDDILRLADAATASGVLPVGVNLGLYALPHAVRIMPLIEEMQAGAELAPEDIRPYRKPIKNLHYRLREADTLAKSATVIGIGIPARRAINRKIETDFQPVATEAIAQAREAIASIEQDVDYLAEFENPKEQFVAEVNELAEMTASAIRHQRNMRVMRAAVKQETKPETPKGLLGLFTKAVRKIKSFFGIFGSRKSRVKRTRTNHEITAYDAGAGLETTFRSLKSNPGTSKKSMPMLTKMLFTRLPDTAPITRDKLAFAAPELLSFIFSTSSEDDKADLIGSVERNPHELRFVTKFKKRYGRRRIESLQFASVNLLPAIRDILPTDGAKIREIFENAQALLNAQSPDKDKESDETK